MGRSELTLTAERAEGIYVAQRHGDAPAFGSLTIEMQLTIIRSIQVAHQKGYLKARSELYPENVPTETVQTDVTGPPSGENRAVGDSSEEWYRDQIFERLMAMRRQRYEQYQPSSASSLAHNMDAVGLAWTGLLTAFYMQALPVLPGWMVCLMQSAQKGVRVVWNPKIADSYEDGMNYIALAEELTHGTDQADQ